VNLGVRWDPYFAYTERQESDRLLSPRTEILALSERSGGLVYAGDSGCPAAGTNGALANFAHALDLPTV